MSMGRIEVIAGCMFSGKTEELVRRMRRATIAKQAVIAFKPLLDDRYTPEDISSHDGVTLHALPILSAADIRDQVGDAKVVGIDEGQFLEGLAEVAQDLAVAGKRVIIVGLDMDYRGVPFTPIAELLAVAERIDKLHAVCVTCGGEATRSQRIVDSEERVVIGAVNAYEARCRSHWSPKPVFSRMDSDAG